MCPAGPEPNTACASCEMTVGAPRINGAAWVHLARNDVPRTKEPRITPIRRYTRRARTPSGGLKTLTPLDIASTPVSEAPPLANERIITSTDAPIRRPLPGVPKW